jgi:hypothetical protein
MCSYMLRDCRVDLLNGGSLVSVGLRALEDQLEDPILSNCHQLGFMGILHKVYII